MPGGVFDTAEANRLLDATFSVVDYAGATTGNKLRLTTTNPTDAAPGTLVSGGSYANQTMAMAAGASRSTSNTGIVAFTGMPVATVLGVDIYNFGDTVRKAWGLLTTPRTTASGDTLSFAIGSIVATFPTGVFDTAEANRLLDAVFSVADYVGAATGSQLRLATTTPTDAAAGTVVTGGSYANQAMAMSAGSARSTQNTGVVAFTGMPVATVTNVDIYNSAGTQRKAWGPLTTPRTTASGDTLSFAIGSIVATF